MTDKDSTREQLIAENLRLRARLADLESSLGTNQTGSTSAGRPATKSWAVEEGWSPEKHLLFANFSVEMAAEEVFWMRDDSKIIYVNDSACTRLGFSRRELLQMYVWQWDPQFPKERWEGFWAEMLQKRSMVFETVHATKNGLEFPVEITAHVFEYSGEKYLFAFARDVTEAKKTADRLQQYKNHLEELVKERTADLEVAKKEAEAANQAKSLFLANMSHELRTPLNAIIGFSEILKDLISEPQQKSYIDRVLNGGNSLLVLINDILDFSKIEAGKLELDYKPTSLVILLEEVTDIFAHTMMQKSIELVVDIAADLPETLMLDGFRTRQILVNLVGNAVKFTKKGSVSIRVRTDKIGGASPGLSRLIFEVADTGIGIHQDQLHTIFDAFEQQKGQDAIQFGGTGLGLAICRRLIEAMGGTITVASTRGKGSTFTVTLEGVVQGDRDSWEKQAEEGFDFDAVTFRPATLLVVDDHSYNRDLLKGFFTRYGLTIIEAENGRQALDLLEQYRPNLVLLDMKMPVMDGYELSRRMKNDRRFQAIPVIAVTASALQADEEVIRRTCDGYLRKPVNRIALVKTVMQFLAHTLQQSNQAHKDGETGLNRDTAALRLQQLPGAMVNNLAAAVKLGDIGLLSELVTGIEDSDHQLADYLRMKLKAYSFTEISALFPKDM